MFDEYRMLPGNWRGMVNGREPLSPQRSAMVKRIAQRAVRWGPLLRGLEASSIALEGLPGRPLRAGLFADGRRRCLLVVNPSVTEFVRGRVTLPNEVAGRPVVRAVGVAVEDDRPVGDVFESRHGGTGIEVDLAPGDAQLYELF